MKRFQLPLALMVLLTTRVAFAGELVLKLSDTVQVKVATVTPAGSKTGISGNIAAGIVTFTDVPVAVSMDIRLELKDGQVLQGVNLNWYDDEPPKPDAGELQEDDRQQIIDIAQKVLSFYNKNDLLLLRGDHDRAVALVQRIRDTAFHSDSGDEVIWHVELWYYKDQHGGWEKVLQQERVLRRERFHSHQDFDRVVKSLRWVPELGGITLPKDQPSVTITLPATAIAGKNSAPAAPPVNELPEK